MGRRLGRQKARLKNKGHLARKEKKKINHRYDESIFDRFLSKSDFIRPEYKFHCMHSDKRNCDGELRSFWDDSDDDCEVQKSTNLKDQTDFLMRNYHVMSKKTLIENLRDVSKSTQIIARFAVLKFDPDELEVRDMAFLLYLCGDVELNPGDSQALRGHTNINNNIKSSNVGSVTDSERVTVNPLSTDGINPLGYVGKRVIDKIAPYFNEPVKKFSKWVAKKMEDPKKEAEMLKLGYQRINNQWSKGWPGQHWDSNFNKFVKDEIKKDLLKEGIEPNPGPKGKKTALAKKVKKVAKNAVKKMEKKAFTKAIGKPQRQYRKKANNIGDLIRAGALVKNPVKKGPKDFMSVTSRGKSDQIRLKGRELTKVGLTTSNTDAPGTYLFGVSLNPTLIGGSRLAAVAPLFEKFFINQLKVIITMDQASTATGGGVGFFEDDAAMLVKNPPAAALLQIAKVKTRSTFVYNRNQHVFTCPRHMINMKMMGHVENIGKHVATVGHSSDESSQGIFIFLTDMAITGSNIYTYNVEIEYTIDLWDAVSASPSVIPVYDAGLQVYSITQTLGSNAVLFPTTTSANGYSTFGPNTLVNAAATSNWQLQVVKGYYWMILHAVGVAITNIVPSTISYSGISPTITSVVALVNGAATGWLAHIKVDCSGFGPTDSAYIIWTPANTSISQYSLLVVKTSLYPSANPLDTLDAKVADSIMRQTGKIPMKMVIESLDRHKPKKNLIEINGMHYNKIEDEKVEFDHSPYIEPSPPPLYRHFDLLPSGDSYAKTMIKLEKEAEEKTRAPSKERKPSVALPKVAL